MEARPKHAPAWVHAALGMVQWTLAGVARVASRHLLRASRDLESPELAAWYRDGGDETLRLDYALDADSLVLDVGAFDGEWAAEIFSRYVCRIHLFEPVAAMAARARRRFAKNPRVAVHEFGLAARDGSARISLAGPGSSLYRHRGPTERIHLRAAAAFMREHDARRVDLMKINIEGGEYELLEHLLDEDLVRGIRDLQVQFHDCIPDAATRMERIQARLAQTHTLTYQYRFVWENWHRAP
jgi:FkbM family methyltransferase